MLPTALSIPALSLRIDGADVPTNMYGSSPRRHTAQVTTESATETPCKRMMGLPGKTVLELGCALPWEVGTPHPPEDAELVCPPPQTTQFTECALRSHLLASFQLEPVPLYQAAWPKCCCSGQRDKVAPRDPLTAAFLWLRT